jgi:hypothetical protein
MKDIYFYTSLHNSVINEKEKEKEKEKFKLRRKETRPILTQMAQLISVVRG